MQSKNLFEEKFSNMLSYKMSHLRKSIHNKKYRIIPLHYFRQSKNKIHSNVTLRFLKNSNRCIQTNILTYFFCNLTNSTTPYKLLNILINLWPIILILQQTQCLINSKISSQSTTMLFLNQINSHGTSRDTQLNWFEQHTFLNEIFIILTYVICWIWFSALSPCLRKIKFSIIKIFHFIKMKNFNLHLGQQRTSSTQSIWNSFSESTLMLDHKCETLQIFNPLHMSLIQLMLTSQICKTLWSIYKTNSLGIK